MSRLAFLILAFVAAESLALEVRVRQAPGGPQIQVDGKPVAPRFFFGCDKAMPAGRVSPFFETVGYCREAGVRFISTGVDFGWRADGEDWSMLDYTIDKILRVHPEALVVPRVVANGADWITENHPDWLMVLSDRGTVECPSVFSEGYRTALRTHLAKFVRHLRERFPDNFAGVHVAAQAYGEFFYYESRGPWLHGYEPAELAAWRAYLAARGEPDAATAPLSYAERKYPAPYLTQSAAESAARYGVLWLDEDDTRTFLATDDTADPATLAAGGWSLTTKEETLDQLRRNLSSAIRRGRASWFMDLASAGWYADRDLWRVFEELRSTDAAALARSAPDAPSAALVLDERGMMCAAERSLAALRPLIYEGRLSFARAGLDVGQYLVDDALDGSAPARLQVFLSTFFADEAMRARIAAARTARPDLTRIWCWAPGYLGPTGADVENIRLTTGFTATRIAAANPVVTATAAGRALGFPERLAGIGTVDPLFSVEATDDETLARWPDGSPAVVRRKAGRGYEVFYGIPVWTPEAVRALAGFAPLSAFSPAVSFASAGVADRMDADDTVDVSSTTSAWSAFSAWFRRKTGFLMRIR